MKRFIYRFLCAFCAAGIIMSCLSFGSLEKVNADEPVGKMSSVYGYVLNDYIEQYGVMSTNSDGVITDSHGEFEHPGGVIYADIMNFDNNYSPYLVIFTADGWQRTVSCHIWRYSDELERAVRIAVIDRIRDDYNEFMTGEFNMAWSDRKRYVMFRTYENHQPVSENFYTVVNGEAFMLVNNPENVKETGITDFNAAYINAGVDISAYNATLDNFFNKLKDTAAKSVSYENVSKRLGEEDRGNICKTLITSALYSDLDVAKCESTDEYAAALKKTTSAARFTQLTAFYDLGGGIYYARFDTNETKYNYAILFKSDKAENGYQILKSRTDCIPLSDRELKQMKAVYVHHPLLYEKSVEEIKLTPNHTDKAAENEATPITVKVGDGEAVEVPKPTPDTEEKFMQKSKRNIKKMFSFEKIFDERIKIPAICIGSGISAALLTFLWIYMYSDEDEE